jgi:hypothetical protein
MKKSRGRPKKAAEDKQTESFLIKLTESEMNLIKKAVGDRKLSTWAREALIRAAKRTLKN